jgi:hypothetical protein
LQDRAVFFSFSFLPCFPLKQNPPLILTHFRTGWLLGQVPGAVSVKGLEQAHLINVQPQYKCVASGAKALSLAGFSAGLKPRPSGPSRL